MRKDEEKKVKDLNPLKITKNRDYLEGKASEEEINWFVNLFQILERLVEEGELKKWKLQDIPVLTGDHEIVKAEEVYFDTLPDQVSKFREDHEEVKKEFEEYSFLHSKLEEEFKEFFEEYTDVSELDMKEVCKKIVLPAVKSPPEEELRRETFKNTILPEYLRLLKEKGVADRDIRVQTKSGELRSIDETYMSKEYNPEITWEKHSDLVGISYISADYVDGDRDVEGWHDFISNCKIKWRERDYRVLAENKILDVIGNLTEKSGSREELLTLTKLTKAVLPKPGRKIWVLTKEEKMRRSDEVFFTEDYGPKENWEKNEKYSPREFLSRAYLKEGNSEEWRRFFKSCDVREEGKPNHVGYFAEQFTKERLEQKGYTGFDEGEKEGFDFKAKNRRGEEVYIEVKGMKSEDNEELTEKQSKFADAHEDSYLACIVPRIPENPELYLVENPAKEGEKKKIAIPKSVWKDFLV
ncbi:hypothetical protein AKJ65_06405 [candidate division MSBL1 archaeon SCGC-AAA259E19]|uniref:Protein NO VEIN C-terminal domain-containing protein n=1 Tax=candidate division MSBL1 archaeon SCGC-AAA259E19 TaxID=1698264 RepID=A0A133UGF9_9EURY|nr:hypothetical protein AKJ65_06405 [candidate division MSBL1 archaeon SCGC-AAA259E19]